MTLHAQSIRKVAEWPAPGALYAGQVHTIDGVEEMIAQGGTTGLPPGDPLTHWTRKPGASDFTGPRVIVAHDSPLIFPPPAAEQPLDERIGSTAMGTWLKRPDGLYEMWFSPCIGNAPTVAAGYEREFVLYHATSTDRRTWKGVVSPSTAKNQALSRALLCITDTITPLPTDQEHYAFTHGIAGTGALYDGGTLYKTLRCFYEKHDEPRVGAQKNVLVRRRSNSTMFEAWMTNGPNDWKVCAPLASGVPAIPAELFTHGNSPHPWPLDSIYLTPRNWHVLSKQKFVAIVGQPEEPQLALTFSDNLMQWSEPLKIELPEPYRSMAGAVNYRTMDPDSGKIHFGLHEQATYEVIVPELVKAKRRAAGR